MFLSAGHPSDYVGARALLSSLPQARILLADRGYDADWFRWALADRGIASCIPSRKGRKIPIPHDPALYRQRHRIENMFSRFKDWRRIATPTTAAPTCSSRPALSRQPSYSGCEASGQCRRPSPGVALLRQCDDRRIPLK
jgi:transposase